MELFWTFIYVFIYFFSAKLWGLYIVEWQSCSINLTCFTELEIHVARLDFLNKLLYIVKIPEKTLFFYFIFFS